MLKYVRFGEKMKINYNKKLYSKAVLLKSAYHFTDRYYFHLDENKEYYIVDVKAKEGIISENFSDLFNNEMLAQATREMVNKETYDIRQLMLGRAFSSTIIEDNSINESSESFDDDSLFKAWSENEDNKIK